LAQNLERTRGHVKLRGKIVGLNNDKAMRGGTSSKGSNWKAVSFFVETSHGNRVRVEIMGSEGNVYAYNQELRETKQLAWSERNKVPEGYNLIGITVRGKNDEDQKDLASYEAIDYIKDNFTDGESVFVSGQIDFQEYENRQGQKVASKRININRIYHTDDIDFTADTFQETASFEQDIVINECIEDADNNKLLVEAFQIKGRGEVVPSSFVVDMEQYDSLAKNIKKRLKFGDFIRVKGEIVNRVEFLQNDEPEETDDDDWGGKDPNGMENTQSIRNYVDELRITNVASSTHEPKKYSEDQLFSQAEENFGRDSERKSSSQADEINDLPF
jgi:hypothetical protein